MADTKYLLELIDILAKGQGMADCAESPLMKLKAKIERESATDDLLQQLRESEVG